MCNCSAPTCRCEGSSDAGAYVCEGGAGSGVCKVGGGSCPLQLAVRGTSACQRPCRQAMAVLHRRECMLHHRTVMRCAVLWRALPNRWRPPPALQLLVCDVDEGVCNGSTPACRCVGLSSAGAYTCQGSVGSGVCAIGLSVDSYSVSTLLPITTTPAPPTGQWWVATQAQSGAASLVNLAAEVAAGANVALTTNPPGGITAAVKLSTPTTNVQDKIDVAVNFPGTPPGLFVGMRFLVGMCAGHSRKRVVW